MTPRDTLPEAVARLARFMKDLGQPAALIGGVGVIARAYVRVTKDIDLLVGCSATDVPELLEAAARNGYGWDDAEVRDFLDAGLLRLWGPPSRRDGFPLDILLVDSAFNDDVIRRSTIVEVLGTEIRVATAEDLLLMKIEANRPIDLDDMFAIKDAFAGRLDHEYLTSQADRIGPEVRRRLDLLLS